MLNSNDPQNAFTNFLDIFSQAHDICFPLKRIKMNDRNNKPWLTNGLKNSIKQKISSTLNQLNLPLSIILTNIKHTKWCWTLYWTKKEQDYYDSRFNCNKNNLKKCSTLIKQIINRRKCSVQSSQFIIDDKITSDSGQIAELLILMAPCWYIEAEATGRHCQTTLSNAFPWIKMFD